MARDQQRDRVAAQGATDRPCRTRCSDPFRDVAVAGRSAPVDLADLAEHAPVPVGPVGQVDGKVTAVGWGALEDRLDGRQRCPQDARSGVVRGSIGEGDDGEVQPCPELTLEDVVIGLPTGRHDPTLRGRDPERRSDPVEDGRDDPICHDAQSAPRGCRHAATVYSLGV